MTAALVTICIGERYERMADLTHPSLAAYAARVGADFRVIDERTSDAFPSWEKLQLRDYLLDYDRVMYFDTDILVREDCPDLLEVAPEGVVGMFDEAPYSWAQDPRYIDALAARGGEYDGRYFNAGVMILAGWQHELFLPPQDEAPFLVEGARLYEQDLLNVRLATSGWTVQDLGWRFNRMFCPDPLGRFDGPRMDAQVLHYAGLPYDVDIPSQMRHDLEVWHGR